MYLFSIDCEGAFKRKCRNSSKVCGFKAKECKKCKGELHGGHNNGDSEGNTGNGGSGKTCNFCGLKGHKEAGCFKKFPKAPARDKEKTVKVESAFSRLEVSLASLDTEKLGIERQ